MSFGHAAFFGLGAYGAALAVKWANLPMEGALPMGLLLAAIGAVAIGAYVVRLSGIYLAMMTLAAAQILFAVAFQWVDVTGGDNGIVGVWPCAAGVIRLDGYDIKQWDPEKLGRHIGYLPQDIELFQGTVAQNIARFTEFEAQEVIDAAMLAGVHEMIQALPQGYDTPIGEGGASLSGGQRQRLALARSVFRMPALLVLGWCWGSCAVRGISR